MRQLDLLDILHQILLRLPVLVVWSGAGVAALVSWKKHPRVSLLLLTTAIVMTMQYIVRGFLDAWLFWYLSRRLVLDADAVRGILVARHVAGSCVAAGAFGVLAAAIFAWRGERVERVA